MANIDIAHNRDIIGWTIDVTVITEKGDASINYVRIEVNGHPDVDERLDSPVNKWHKTLRQAGVYPGDNKVVALAMGTDGTQTRAQDEWTN